MQNFLNGVSSEQEREITDEQLLITRAGRILMLYLNMSEAAAHRYIDKRAADMRTTKKEIAKNILKTYEP